MLPRVLVNALATRAGGAANRLRKVATRAPDLWAANVVLLRNSEVALDDELPSGLSVDGWPVGLDRAPALPRRLAEPLVVRHAIRSLRPQAVLHYATYVPVGRIGNCRNVLCFVSLAPWDPGPAARSTRNTILRALFERTRTLADVIVVQSEATRAFLGSKYPDIVPRLRVVTNGLSIPFIPVRHERRDFFVAGDVYGYRRIDEVVRAYAALPHSVRSRHALTIAGNLHRDAGAVADVRRAVADTGVKRVELLGLLPREAILERMATACAFVSYAAVENGPNAVMEAVAVGAPCILSAIPVHHEFARGRAWFAESRAQISNAMIQAATESGVASDVQPVDTWDEHVRQLGAVLRLAGVPLRSEAAG